MNKINNKGKVYLVGAGPGDPNLITMRGKMLLEQADVVVYDYLANPKLLNHAPKKSKKIYVGKKGCGLHAFTQEEINQMLLDFAHQGKKVIRLKGGDPFIFGRGAEELEGLVKEKIDFEVVPGVTSATAAATYAGVPITHRDYTASVAFITGHEAKGKTESNIDWQKLATGAGTLVIYMGIKNLARITQKLIDNGRSPQTPVAVIRWASTPKQKSVEGTLETISQVVKENDIKAPALIIVGDVVKLRNKINWFEKRVLFNRNMLITRTREQASELVSALEENGANCIEIPTLHMEPMTDTSRLDAAIAQINNYKWIIFTSINAVNWFFKRIEDKGLDARVLFGVKIAVIGQATAKHLRSYGLKADLIPKVFTGEGLAEAMLNDGISNGDKILIPRALKAREILPAKLRQAQADVDIIPVYQNVVPEKNRDELRQLLENKEIDLITFTSSSTVNNFVDMLAIKDKSELQRLLSPVTIASIGPITSKTVEEQGLVVDIQPKQATIQEMVNAITSYFQSKKL